MALPFEWMAKYRKFSVLARRSLWDNMTYTISKAARSTHGQDGAIVLDVEQGEMFGVNLIGSRILKLLESGSTNTEIVSTICREFKADPNVVENDLHEFINSLKKHKLLTER